MNKNEGFNRDLSWGTNYQGAVTLFGMLRDIDPTKIYTKYDGHNHYRKFEDYDKFFLERGFERHLINVAFSDVIEWVKDTGVEYSRHYAISNPVYAEWEFETEFKENVNRNQNSTLYDDHDNPPTTIEYTPMKFRGANGGEFNRENDNIVGDDLNIFEEASDIRLGVSHNNGSVNYVDLPNHIVVYLHRAKLQIYYIRTDLTKIEDGAKGYMYGYLHYTPENKKEALAICQFMLASKPAKKTQYKLKIVIIDNGNIRSDTRILDTSSSILFLPIKKNYNDDLNINKVYEFIESDSGGLMVLHGEPGTGKTSLIKHLMQRYNNSDVAPKNQKSFIYLPANIAHQIDNPSWLPFFLENSGSIFIIEDAEQLVKSRSQGNSGLSAFLNATDGILSDMLAGKFIVTFNAKINQDSVDEALLRKGRLKYIYEFKKLTKEKCSQFLGKPVDQEYSLTDLFNWDEETNKKESSKKIGF